LRTVGRRAGVLTGLVGFAAFGVLAGSLLFAAGTPTPLAAAPSLTTNGPSLLGPLPFELEYRARKLFFSTVTRARLELVPAASVGEVLRTPPVGSPIPLPAETVAVLTVESELPLGRHEVVRLLLDPRTGAALQGEKVAVGRRTYRSVSRYLKAGIYSWRWSPADGNEGQLPPERWTNLTESFFRFPAELPAGGIVTDAYAVIALSAAAHFERPAGALQLFVLSYHNLLALDFSPQGFEQRKLEVDEQNASGTRVQSGPRLVRVVGVSTRAVPGTGRESAHDLGVLGFEGGMSLMIDASTGLPVGFAGHVPYLGTLTARLTRVRY
jgi:hypothetical protein